MGLNLVKKKIAQVVDKSSKILLVGWLNPQPELPPFCSQSYEGSQLETLIGKSIPSFCIATYLFDEEMQADEDVAQKEARERATRLLNEFPTESLILIGVSTLTAFGAYQGMRKNGYAEWFMAGNRLVSALPGLEHKNIAATGSWWGKEDNRNRARLFFRGSAGLTPLGTTPRFDLDPIEIERLAQCHVTIAEAAGILGVGKRTLERKLSDPEYREAWDRGRSDTALALRRKQMDLAMRGNTRMLIHLGEHLLGQKRDASLQVQVGDSASARITFSRDELENELRTLDAEFQVREEKTVKELNDVNPSDE